MDERQYYLGFSLFPGIGPIRFKKLLVTFGSAENAWNASEKEIEHAIGEITSQNLTKFKKTFSLEKYLEGLERKQIQYITLLDKEYPLLLRHLKSKAPYVLYAKGDISVLNNKRIIGIVGTRKITEYGKQVTQLLTSQLIGAGFTIVSGLAFGVDATAHATTMDCNGKTIAVLGCGVDCCTPPSNQRIYDRILDTCGTIVSTFLPGQQATIGSFPARNSIIAGLSLAVLVTEGASDSGALITAQKAKEFGRPVFTVPGPITSYLSKGSNSLLSQGAIAVTDGEDVIKTLSNVYPNVILASDKGARPGSLRDSGQARMTNYSKDEQIIIGILESGPLHFDQIVRKIGKDAKEIGSLLSMMEIKNMIKNNGGVYSL